MRSAATADSTGTGKKPFSFDGTREFTILSGLEEKRLATGFAPQRGPFLPAGKAIRSVLPPRTAELAKCLELDPKLPAPYLLANNSLNEIVKPGNTTSSRSWSVSPRTVGASGEL